MDDLAPTDLKSVLHSKRANIYYLEHCRVHDCLLPQVQRFRYDPQQRDDVALLPDEEEETLRLHRVHDGERRYDKLYVPIHQSLCHPVPTAQLASPSVSPWPQVDLMEELAALAQARGLSLEQCRQAACNFKGCTVITAACKALSSSATRKS